MSTWTAKDGTEYLTVTEADEVTEEILDLARGAVDGWFNEGPIDWEAVWDRIEGSRLGDSLSGPCLDLGTEDDSAAMRKIQKVIRAERRAG